MKKIIFTLLISVIFFKSYSQQCLYIGGGATLTMPFIVNQNDYGANMLELNYKNRLGYGINGTLGINMHDNMGLHFEAGYAHMGQKYEDNFANAYYPGKHTKDIKLDYFQFLAAYHANSYAYKNYQFDAIIGPQFGFLMHSNFSYKVNGVETPYPLQDAIDFHATYPVATDYKDFFKKFDAGLAVQGGVNILPIEAIAINIGLRVYYAFTDLNSKTYTTHKNYAPSHNFYGGLHLSARWNVLKEDDFPLIDRYK